MSRGTKTAPVTCQAPYGSIATTIHAPELRMTAGK